MKHLYFLIMAMLLGFPLLAQKVEYNNSIINVDGKDVAKVVRIKDKQNFGLTSSFQLYSLTGEKLVIATVATDFEEARNDNSSYYYRFSFLTAKQVAIFTLNKLGAEKSFAKLIGESGIIVNNQVDEFLLNEFIAMKSRNPKTAVEYKLVTRNRMMPVMVRDGQVYQGNILIGEFKDVTSKSDLDSYEFSLPGGLVVAKVSFVGGNNGKNSSVITLKDQTAHTASIASEGTHTTFLRSEGVDRNDLTLKKIAGWLVAKRYL